MKQLCEAGALLRLPNRLAGGAFSILALALETPLLGKVARFHDHRANLASRQPHGGGVTGPGQIGSMQVSAVMRIVMELA